MGSSSSERSIRLVISLPSCWLAYKCVEAGLLISQNPDWFKLYSDKKLLFLICCGIACFIGFRLSQKIKIPEQAFRLWACGSGSPRTTFVAIALVSCLLFSVKGMSVGEDIAGQVKSSLQWHEGIVDQPNFLANPEWKNLAADEKNWSPRPPGASLLPIPGLLLGLSLGNSLRIGLFLCILAGGLGWIKFCKNIGLSSDGLLLLAIIVGIAAGSASASYATANIILFALAPWFILWAIGIGSLIEAPKSPSSWKKLLVQSIFFLLLLGSFAWIKLSGIIVAGTIAAYPFFRILQGKNFFQKKVGLAVLYILLGGFFWLPFIALERVNHNLLGFTANDLYSANDSDLQAPLFGKYFEKSTRGGWLAWSTIGAPGYALPAKGIGHGLRDMMIQFENVESWLDRNESNKHVLFAGLWAIVCTVLLAIGLQSVWGITPSELRLTYACFLFLPFIGLAILSRKYGFNYLLYHAHTMEYKLIYSLPALFLVSSPIARSKVAFHLLLWVCLAIPITTQIEKTFLLAFHKNQFKASGTEQNRGFEPREFSHAISMIEQDSKSNSDILLFLPEGDMGDLIIRTKLRAMAIHFAGDNLEKYGACLTSKPSTLYCAYSASLKDNKAFQDTLGRAFPQATETIELTKAEANDAIVIRITLEPNQKGST